MWIRSRLSLLLFAIILIYALVGTGFFMLFSTYEDRKRELNFINQSRYILLRYEAGIQAKPPDETMMRERIKDLLFLLQTSKAVSGRGRAYVRDLLNEGKITGLTQDAITQALDSLTSLSITMEKSMSRSLFAWPIAGVLFILILMLGALLSLYFINQSILDPILALKSATKAIGRGELDEPLPPFKRNEVGLLSAAVEEMRVNLKATMAKLDDTHRQMREREKMAALGEVCAAVAHSIRNPLAAIRSSAQLETKAPSPQNLDDIIQEVDLLNSHLKILLDFIHPLHLYAKKTTLTGSLREAIKTLEQAFASRKLHFILAVPATLKVFMDKPLLDHLLLTILENACEASSDGGEIRVSASIQETRIVVEVEDRGRGIPEETLKRLFKPFISSKPDGTGLGLALTKKIVDAHGGNIEVFSEGGRGTLVRLLLPGKEQHEADPHH